MTAKKIIMLSNENLKKIIENSQYYTYFKDRLYVYDQETKTINGYMLKENYDPETTLNTPDNTAAEKFAVITMTFKKGEEELFDEEDFVDVVIQELEVWLSYDSTFEE